MSDRPTQTARIIDAALWLEGQKDGYLLWTGSCWLFAIWGEEEGDPSRCYADTWWDAVLTARDHQSETPGTDTPEGSNHRSEQTRKRFENAQAQEPVTDPNVGDEKSGGKG